MPSKHPSIEPSPPVSGPFATVLVSATFPRSKNTYALEMEDIEARSRLASVLDVCEYEMQALEALRDPRLSGVVQAMTTLRAEVVAALATLTPDASNGR